MSSPLQSNIRFNVIRELKKILSPKSKINSYFLYDANVEIALSNYDFHVCSITNKKIILDFWNFTLQDPENLAKYVDGITDDRLNFINVSAEQMDDYLREQKVDVIVSTLPFGSLPKKMTKTILQQAKAHLKKGGMFLQYQYFLNDKRLIENIFKRKAKISFEALNIPPAFIYRIEK